MLSLIPQILWLSPFSSTILRLGAGIAFMYAGYAMLVRHGEYTAIRLPFIGHAAAWMVWASGVIIAIDGFAILIGFGTQAAAIVGMIIAVKHFSLSKKYETVRPLPRSAYALLFLMCTALLISGAGPLGFDLPL
jgi:uncharacterized membrane protein YphA (DoxX/SURF4 family)